MMASLTASTDEMKKELPSRRQTQLKTMQPKIGSRRSIHDVLIKKVDVLTLKTITMVKTGEDVLEINQTDVSTLHVSFS